MTVLGYRDNVPELMRAADLLVTKAGPGAIAEASVAEVPVVVYDFVPGQERGNLDYVRTNGIGVVALTTADVVRSVRRIVSTRNACRRCASRQSQRRPARQLAPDRRADRKHGADRPDRRRPAPPAPPGDRRRLEGVERSPPGLGSHQQSRVDAVAAFTFCLIQSVVGRQQQALGHRYLANRRRMFTPHANERAVGRDGPQSGLLPRPAAGSERASPRRHVRC